ncbi:MAG: Pyruvate:ferredoxin oxidoreductase, alpha subunit (EC [uncultured Campylobacterales bacterium]|uniref:Pyruvate:ferredoxin oxidoreductase, alpha subunit (EC) n=1 Tax=uncultured Campylobacterales bacterium TaxID=352960 RepID=A0A6S6RZZ1_9BACT|nr:MAG: Pyruvate:ferredoxin oxidoreductase, alpha subunit (EC [uncultured Campylobacterales bacterium]
MSKEYVLKEVEFWDGAMASSQALRQAEVDIMAAYPITPSTPIIQNYADYLSNGYVDGEYIRTESEHAAMSACVAASAAGARVTTATSSQGFALMIEVLYQASGMRLPVVLNVANRALAAPLNVNGDHSDLYLGRDAGWINLCTFNQQEVYDMTLMSFKIGEHKNVRLPVMVHQDGFICSHTAQNVAPLQDDVARKFVGDFEAVDSLLDFARPVTYGAQTEEDWHFEHKAKQHKAIMDSINVIEDTFEEFEKLTGRKYNAVESYMMEDAEIAIVALGTTIESSIEAARQLREEGIKVGIVAPRVFRPFPYDKIADALKNVKAIGILDRSSPGGALGMLFNEVTAAIYTNDTKPVINNYIYGLGGRDTTIADLKQIAKEIQANADAGKLTTPVQQFSGLRGPKLSFFDMESSK